MDVIQEQKGKYIILSGVMLAMLLSSLDQTIVSTAMPTIVQELHGLEHFSWVFTAYMLGSTVTVPVYGKLSDMFGRRNLYLLGIVIFLIGSILCGMSGSMNQLIAFRAVQGVGGGAMMVNSFAIIGDVFPPAERGKFQGYIGAVFGLSSIAGPLLGGWITDHTDWRWVFYVNIPLGILAFIVLWINLPKIRPSLSDRRIDWWGAFFITLALVPLLLSLVWGGSVYEWTSVEIISSLVLSLLAFLMFIYVERKAANPLLSLGLFKNRVFVVSVCCLFLTAMAMFGAIMYVPIFSQGVIGGSATHAGLVLTPMMLSMVTASTLTGLLISRTGKYKFMAVLGTGFITAALFFFSTISAHTTSPGMIFRMILFGLGLGATTPIFTLAVQSAFPKERLGEVTAGSQLFRSVGGTVGTAILGGILNNRLSSHMKHLITDPFVVEMNQLGLARKESIFSSSFIQNVLNRENQEAIKAMFSRVPIALQPKINADFLHFIELAKEAFSDAVGSVFFAGACFMVVSLVIVVFLPEIPLRKSERPVLEEAGMEMEDQMGHSDKRYQPRVLSDKDGDDRQRFS